MIYTVYSLGNGWYSFKDIPQEGRYVKIDGLCCGADNKAIAQARKILNASKAVVVIVSI